MDNSDKRTWLRKHGKITHAGYNVIGVNLSWKPFGHGHDDYYYECRAPDMMEAYAKLYDEAKETLYQECRDINGCS